MFTICELFNHEIIRNANLVKKILRSHTLVYKIKDRLRRHLHLLFKFYSFKALLQAIP